MIENSSARNYGKASRSYDDFTDLKEYLRIMYLTGSL